MARIFFIDDDASCLEVISKYLGKFGHAVECMPNSRSALEQVICHTPDLVILDLCMPQFDGCSLLETVRSYLRLQALPIIVLTGVSDGPMIDRARAQEANAILVKGKATMEQIEEAVRLELDRTHSRAKYLS
jgi:CheY-like chemotaxis protein